MTVYEMEGFLRGKCLPGDMKVNESNAQYLVRKFSEFESNLSESKREFRAADATIHNLELKLTDMAVQLANAESKCRELETRAVNLPKRSVGEVMHMSGFSRDYAEGWCAGNDNAIHEIRSAGIGVKGE